MLVVWPFFVDIFRLPPVVVGGLAVIVGVWRPCSRSAAQRHTTASGGALISAGLGLFSTIAFWPLVSSFLFGQILPVCRANLRAIGHALRDYYDDNGTYPPDLTPLFEQGFVTEMQLQVLN